jgi:hypothetical protein
VRQKLNRHTSVGALGMTSAAPCPRSSVPPLCSVYATNSGRWCCHDEANYDYLLEFLIGDVLWSTMLQINSCILFIKEIS